MKWGFRKPFGTLLVSMLLVVILPLLLNSMFYLRFRSAMLEQQAAVAEEAMRFHIQQVDSLQKDLIMFSTRLEAELRRASVPSEQEMDNAGRLAVYELSDTLNREKKSLAHVNSVYLYFQGSESAVGDNGLSRGNMIWEKYYSSRSIPEETVEQLHRQASRGAWVPLGNDCTAFIYTISRDEAGKPERQLVCLLEQDFFKNLLEECNMEGSILLLTKSRNRTVLAVSNKAGIELSQEELGRILGEGGNEVFKLSGQNALLRTVKSTASGCQMTTVIPSSELLAASSGLHWYYWSVMIASIVLGLLLAVFFSRRNMIPLNQLIAYIRENFGEKHPDSQGLEQIKDAIDGLLEQQSADRSQLIHFETLAILNELRESFRGNEQIGKNFQLPSGCRYVVVRFSDPQAGRELMESEIVKSLDVFPNDVIRYSISLDNTVAEILGMASPEFQEEKVQELLTLQIGQLDQQGKLTVRAAFSRVYSEPQELERAYEEACAAEVCAAEDEEAVLTSFSSCKFQASKLLRDWHHLDKQLQFSTLLGEEQYEEAAELLPALFPVEFLEELFSESDISRLHLDSLKYQFLHDLDTVRESAALSDEAWSSLFQQILYTKTHRSLYQLMEGLCAELISAAQKPVSEEQDDKSVEKIKRYIRDHYAEPQLSVSSIAEAFGLSPNSLSQLFSRKSDHGVLGYIHKIRMKKAAELLLSHRELTIQSIAEQVGYTSILTFNRKFKSYYGQTAGEYRKGSS